MTVRKEIANQRFAGLNHMTFTESRKCPHHTGWYVRVKFWIFTKRVFVCSNCGHLQEQKSKT